MKYNILMLFGADSCLEWGSSFQVAKSFCNLGHNVVYVELPASIKNLFSIQLVNEKYFKTIKPKCGLPYGKFELLQPLNRLIVKFQIMKFLIKNNFQPDLLWIYAPYDPYFAVYLKKYYDIKLCIYHSAGDRESLALQRSGEKSAKKIVEKEKLIIENCNAIVVENINSKRYKFVNYDNVYVLSSGVDTDVFDFGKYYDVPKEYDLGKKIILYMGTIEVWLDLDLICSVADKFKDANIYLVGPVRDNVDPSKLKTCSNIVMTGSRPYNLMPNYIQHSDVCIVPFKDTPSLKFSSTLKCLQYLSMGKNVVSTYYDGVNSYDEKVHVEFSYDKFISKIEMLLIGQNIDNNFAQEFVEKHSWDQHVSSVLNEMEFLFNK